MKSITSQIEKTTIEKVNTEMKKKYFMKYQLMKDKN